MSTLPESSDPRAEAAVFQSMALLSALATASAVWQSARERRAGHDPSDQEPEAFVRPFLLAAAAELEPILLRLQASLMHVRMHDEPHLAVLVRRFDDLMTLTRAARLLNRIHQRLLSLYPDVDEALVEAARRLTAESSALLDDEVLYADRLAAFVDDGFEAMRQLREAAV